MRTFSVFVTGIAAFVEDYRRALAVHEPNPRILATTADGRSDKSSYTTVPAHFPHVRLPIGHIDDTTLGRYSILHDWNVSVAPVFPPDNPQTANPMIRQTLVKFLHFQEVVLPPSDTPQSLDETPLNATGFPIFDQQPGGPPPDATSLLWLAKMEDLGTRAKTIDPRHVVKNPDRVAAYIRFPNGRMSTAFPTNFKFVSVSLDGIRAGGLDQAVAQLIVCRMSVPDEAFTVLCRDYKTAEGVGDFEIRFKANEPDPWMVFACTSLEDVFQLRSVNGKFGVDSHFRLVYDLAEGGVTDADVVLPKSIDPGLGMPRPLGAGECVPPRFRGGSTGGL